MDSQTTRTALSVAAAIATAAAVASYLGLSPSSAAGFSTQRRHVLPSVSSSLALWRRLELRKLQSLTYLLAAFGPDGYNAPGSAPGCMVASPSRPDDRPGGKNENENYFYQWPRDSALCLRQVIQLWTLAQKGHDIGVSGEKSADLERIIRDTVTMNVKLQHTDNPSGTFKTGGLGEPKFNVDGSPFDADWGRPQNDGPALRAVSMLYYANYLLDTEQKDATNYVRNTLYQISGDPSQSLIKDDLDYVARAWKDNSFELWEEVQADSKTGGHFHTLMVQRRALLAGARFAERSDVGDESSAQTYKSAAQDITKHIELFWNPEGALDKEGGPVYDEGPLSIDWNDARHLGRIPKELLHKPHVVGTLGRMGGQPKPCQVDTAVLLGFTHGWDGDLATSGEAAIWAPWSDRCLMTLDRLVDVFAVVYPLNAKRSSATGVMCGRYPEDVYDGVVQSIGHPWFLCTHAVSEVLSIVAHHHAAQPSLAIVVTEQTVSFWQKVTQAASAKTPTQVRPGKYGREDDEYAVLMRGLWRMGDGYLRVCDEFVGKADRMSEQVERSRGAMRGARELSWSYASFLSAMAARKGQFMTI